MADVNHPVFCLTSDVDWASDTCIRDLAGFAEGIGVVPTFFATHSSEALDELETTGRAQIGVHPNFLPGSTHGATVDEVIDHVVGLYPGARAFRSHCFVDSTPIVRAMRDRGIRYDSNLCLFLQPDLVPLHHGAGTLRLPVFWEDDCHWDLTGADWDLEHHIDAFFTPGLKILNVHPFTFATNVPDGVFYSRVKQHATTLTPEECIELRYQGAGTRTFVTALLRAAVARGTRFNTLQEIAQMAERSEPDDGRVTVHTESEHRRYREMSDAEKQDFLRREYETRSPTDPYATSRDYNVRELEIDAIHRSLRGAGTVLDLGCGNGYTILSLAERITGDGWMLRGVDFTEPLVLGARQLAADRAASLHVVPEFECADAVQYLRGAGDGSTDYLVTERFVQNLPNTEMQHEVIREAARVLRPGGRYLMCEGSQDGHDGLNDLREAVGLARIPDTTPENVSSLRFDDRAIERYATDEAGLTVVDKVGFSTFFMITRVLHPLLVAPEEPRFDAPINDLAGLIQRHVELEPGVGSNVLWVLEKSIA